ncbi:MAG: DUF5996 family protein [Gemmatimonadota bacterium]
MSREDAPRVELPPLPLAAWKETKTTLHLFCHSFDLALTRFNGARRPEMPEADPVSKEAYYHEVVSFGFWVGDENIPEPAFYSYTHPEPEGITQRDLDGPGAEWHDTGRGHLALLRWKKLRGSDDPRSDLLDFLESAHGVGAGLRGWPVESLRIPRSA